MPLWITKSPPVFCFVFIVLFNHENYERKKKKQPVKVFYPSNTVPFQSSVDTDDTWIMVFGCNQFYTNNIDMYLTIFLY